MKKLMKIIALFISLIMMVQCFSVISFAETMESEVTDSISLSTEEPAEEWYLTDEQEVITDEIIGNVAEITSLREENVKHFRLSDGTYEAVVYSQPVHRKDKNGEWQNIDNTIELKTDAKVSKYVTQDSRVSFANKFEVNSDLFTLSENGYSISMSLLNGGTELGKEIETIDFEKLSTPIVNNSSSKRTANVFSSLEEAKSVDNKSSIVYNNIRKNTNLEYVLSGNDVKENIIINAPCESYEYIFQITLDGLYAELDGNVIFIKDIETSQTKYTIPTPYMYDANGTYSYEVSYALEQVKDEIYLLVISADAEWINSAKRAFPVVIDPSVTTDYEGYDSYTNSAYPNNNYGSASDLWVSNICTTYIYLPLPALPSGATLNTAHLYVPYYYHITTGRLKTGAYRVSSSWSESTIRYNNAPQLVENLSYATLSASTSVTQNTPGEARYSIIKAVRAWYQGTAQNYGIAIKREESDTATNQSVLLRSYESGYEEPAYMTINYTYTLANGVYSFENAGLSDCWISVKNDSCWAGAKLQYEQSAIDPTDSSVFDRSRLFKITRVGNYDRYTIRSMLNNNLSFNIVGDKVFTKEIPSIDIEVPLEDTFYIQWSGDGFIIQPYDSSSIISISSSSSSDLSFKSDSSESSSARWIFKQYTGVHKNGAKLLLSEGLLGMNNPSFVKTATYSTYPGYNTSQLEISAGDENKLTLEWDCALRRAMVCPLQEGTVSIDSKISNGIQSDGSAVYTVTNDTLIIPVSEGIYFLKSDYNDKYFQIEENPSVDYSSEDATMEIRSFSGGDFQKWEFIYNDNGYYRIISKRSGLALSVQNGYINSSNSLIQENYTGNDRQQWKITCTPSETYVIRPKSGEVYTNDWCMSVSNMADYREDGGDVVQQVYTDDSSARDEWILIKQKDYTLMYAGEYANDPLMPPILNNVENMLVSTGMSGYGYTDLSRNELLIHLSSTKIFSCITHGESTNITVSGGNYLHAAKIEDLDDSAFEDLGLVVLVACDTAKDVDGETNFATAMYNKDARTVIGFNTTIYVNEANAWAQYFMEAFSTGITLAEALEMADNLLKSDPYFAYGEYSGLTVDEDNRVVLGDDQITLEDIL